MWWHLKYCFIFLTKMPNTLGPIFSNVIHLWPFKSKESSMWAHKLLLNKAKQESIYKEKYFCLFNFCLHFYYNFCNGSLLRISLRTLISSWAALLYFSMRLVTFRASTLLSLFKSSTSKTLANVPSPSLLTTLSNILTKVLKLYKVFK